MFVSVALCTFNGEIFLRQQLDSILVQSITVNEIIICDDLSSDGTISILNEYKNNFPQLIKLFFNTKTLGTIKNFEKAISLTNGDLIFLADQDDIWYYNKVEIMSDFFKKNQNCKLLFSNGTLIDEKGNVLNSTLWEKWNFTNDMQNNWKINKNAFKDLVVNNNKITGATVCFNKSLKKYVIPIELPLGYWHDAWLGIHASAQNGLMFIEESLINYRIHDKQQVGISTDISYEVVIASNKRHINKNLFYEKIGKIYPDKKTDMPYHKEEKVINRILKKIKNYLS